MKYENYYLIGIGGSGMSAIARYFKQKGADVSGYDSTPQPMTRALISEGIPVHYEPDIESIPKDTARTLIIYTPAIPEKMPELAYVKSSGYKVLKRSQVLGELTVDQTCFGVAGSHGKTTTTTLVAHILKESGTDCSAFIGGVSRNYGTNMLIGKDPAVVVEADEFDRSFLQLHPDFAAITSMDPEHLDIYGTYGKMCDGFRDFASQVKDTLIVRKGLPVRQENTPARLFTYHLDDPAADFHATNLRKCGDGHYMYDLVYPAGVLEDIKVGVIGTINVDNSIAAAAICLCHGVDAQKVRRAIGTFMGAQHRLEMHLNTPHLTFFDDYGHHPKELDAAISTVRDAFPDRKITALFQPHTYTRTRDMHLEFAQVLSKADDVILLDLFPAREEPIPGVDSDLIFKDITVPKALVMKCDMLEYLKTAPLDILITLGCGDISRYADQITEVLKGRL